MMNQKHGLAMGRIRGYPNVRRMSEGNQIISVIGYLE